MVGAEDYLVYIRSLWEATASCSQAVKMLLLAVLLEFFLQGKCLPVFWGSLQFFCRAVHFSRIT